MYKLGSFLRHRYNNFLGDIYKPGVTRVRSTGKFRTMASAELVNAGLWPPSITQQWNRDLIWLPIPYGADKAEFLVYRLEAKCTSVTLTE